MNKQKENEIEKEIFKTASAIAIFLGVFSIGMITLIIYNYPYTFYNFLVVLLTSLGLSISGGLI